MVLEFKKVSFGYDDAPVLKDLTVSVPAGVTAVTGPNGTGKSTFLLLASGRLLPNSGTILLEGKDTADLDETERNRLCSLVFQNMEFETEEPLGPLLDFVLANGFLKESEQGLLKSVVETFELGMLLSRPTSKLSKGEMQRAVMAFSLLYGSRVVVMDEPVFALESHQKQRALEFICQYARNTGTSFLYSAHDLDLNRAYSDRVFLFSKTAAPQLGSAAALLSLDSLEAAYQVPYSLLYQKEELHRAFLQERRL